MNTTSLYSSKLGEQYEGSTWSSTGIWQILPSPESSLPCCPRRNLLNGSLRVPPNAERLLPLASRLLPLASRLFSLSSASRQIKPSRLRQGLGIGVDLLFDALIQCIRTRVHLLINRSRIASNAERGVTPQYLRWATINYPASWAKWLRDLGQKVEAAAF